MPAPGTFLEWDSEFFGRRIGRVEGERLDAGRLADIRRWAVAESLDGFYFLADPVDGLTVRLAEQAGWRLMDVRITLEFTGERSVSDCSTHVNTNFQKSDIYFAVRLARADDISRFRETAREAFAQSRFFRDPQFGPEAAGRLFEVWLERSILDRTFAETTLVVEADGPAGFVSCHLEPEGTGRIGLVGVAAAYRGHGIGRTLVREALRWFEERNVTAISVATQGANVAAQRLYQTCGFLTRDVRLWYHWWRKHPTERIKP